MRDGSAPQLPLSWRALRAVATCAGALAGIAGACWRGELPLWLATVVLAGACSLLNPAWSVVERLTPAGPRGLLELAVLTGWAMSSWLTLAWAAVSFGRSLSASWRQGGAALVAVGAALLMAQVGAISVSSARQMTCYSAALWRETLPAAAQSRQSARAVVAYDEASRTLWVRGALEIGVASDFRDALRAHPLVRTVGLQSPGGYVAEARSMSAEVLQRRLDTYVPERCASACVDVFAAGSRRWAGPQAEFAMHRSGHECASAGGFRAADLEAAAFLRDRGVADDFVQRAFEASFEEAWAPDIRTVLESGLATGLQP